MRLHIGTCMCVLLDPVLLTLDQVYVLMGPSVVELGLMDVVLLNLVCVF